MCLIHRFVHRCVRYSENCHKKPNSLVWGSLLTPVNVYRVVVLTGHKITQGSNSNSQLNKKNKATTCLVNKIFYNDSYE
jgi:hypothetical protein